MTEQKMVDDVSAMSREQLTARVTYLMPGMTLDGLMALVKAAEVIAVEHARRLDERSLAEEQRAREGAPVDAVMLNLDPQIRTSPMAAEVVYFCCPGEPKPCIGSGLERKERACPNCGQWCVPYPSEGNLKRARASGYAVPGEVVDVEQPGDRAARSFGPRDEEPIGWQETQAEARTRQEVR